MTEKFGDKPLEVNKKDGLDYSSELINILKPRPPISERQKEKKEEILNIMKSLLNFSIEPKFKFKEDYLIEKFQKRFKETFNNNASIEEKETMKSFILQIREYKLNEIYYNILKQNKGIDKKIYKSDFINSFKKHLVENTGLQDKKFDFSKESVDLMNTIRIEFKENKNRTIKRLLNTSYLEKDGWYGSKDQKPGEIIVSLFHGPDRLKKNTLEPIRGENYEIKEVSPNQIIIAGNFKTKENTVAYDFFEVKTRTAGDVGKTYYDSNGISKSKK